MNADRKLWRLGDRVVTLLGAELALTDDQLAERLGASRDDIRTIVAILTNQRRIERCGAYLVLLPSVRPDRPCGEVKEST